MLDEAHEDQHRQARECVAGWVPGDYDRPDHLRQPQRDAMDEARAALLLHMGSMHGWSPKDGRNVTMTTLHAHHDHAHGGQDVLGWDWFLPVKARVGLGLERRRLERDHSG